MYLLVELIVAKSHLCVTHFLIEEFGARIL